MDETMFDMTGKRFCVTGNMLALAGGGKDQWTFGYQERSEWVLKNGSSERREPANRDALLISLETLLLNAGTEKNRVIRLSIPEALRLWCAGVLTRDSFLHPIIDDQWIMVPVVIDCKLEWVAITQDSTDTKPMLVDIKGVPLLPEGQPLN